MIFGRGRAGERSASAGPEGEGPPVPDTGTNRLTTPGAGGRAGTPASPPEVIEQLAELARLQRERARLIELCLYARDRVGSVAAADRIDAGLVELGITPLRPDGEQFDPARHEAATGVPTPNATLHGTVAETELPGYSDRGRVVRPPVVAVYRRDR